MRRQPLDENAGLAKGKNDEICDVYSGHRVTGKGRAFVQHVAAFVNGYAIVEDHWVWIAFGNFAEETVTVMGLEAEACA